MRERETNVQKNQPAEQFELKNGKSEKFTIDGIHSFRCGKHANNSTVNRMSASDAVAAFYWLKYSFNVERIE